MEVNLRYEASFYRHGTFFTVNEEGNYSIHYHLIKVSGQTNDRIIIAP